MTPNRQAQRTNRVAARKALKGQVRPHAIAVAVGQACALLALGATTAWAGPQGGVVRQGQASIASGLLETTVVQKTERAVIDWRSFDLKSFESVKFLQPSASAAILNRVAGDRRSDIAGRIASNGQVFLINPYGILFTKNALVDVGGLVASTADISDSAFMRGGPALRFDKPGRADASIVNEGLIQLAEGGVLAMVARSVTQQGTVRARLGKVSLAGGDAFTLEFAGDRLVNLILDPAAMETLTDAQGNKLAALVDAKGNIRVEGGTLDLTAETVSRALDNVIKISGDVRATRVEARGDGKIRLLGGDSTDVSIGGTVEVQGVSGALQARGRDITVEGGALVGITQAGAGGAQAAGVDLSANRQLTLGRGATIESQTAATRLSGVAGVDLQGAVLGRGVIAINSTSGRVAAATPIAGVVAGQASLLPTDVSITARNGIELAGVNAGGALSVMTATGDITSTGALRAEGSLDVRASSGSAGTSQTPVTVIGSSKVSMGASGGVFASAVQAPGAITLDGGVGGVHVASPIHGGLSASSDKLADAVSAGALSVVGAGKVHLAGVKATGVNIGSESASAGAFTSTGPLLAGDGGVSIYSSQSMTLSAAVKSDGNVKIKTVGSGGADIDVAGTSSSGGIEVTKSGGSIELDAAGSIRLNAGLKTAGMVSGQGGGISLKADSGNIAAKLKDGYVGNEPQPEDAVVDAGNASIKLYAPKGSVTMAGMRAGVGIDIEARDDVVLSRALGGSNTGYVPDKLGYQNDQRPDVGTLKIRAGSVELNGLNLDGIADPQHPADRQVDNGLDVEVSGILLSNDTIAVNKGGIRLVSTGDGSPTAGIYLGNDVVVRGFDYACSESPSGCRITYPITIQTNKLNLFDNTTGQAGVPDIQAVPEMALDGEGTPIHTGKYFYTNLDGVVVDRYTGIPDPTGAKATMLARSVFDPGTGATVSTDYLSWPLSDAQVALLQDRSLIDPADSRIPDEVRRFVIGGGSVTSGGIAGLPILRTIAKITIGNHVFNYAGSTSPDAQENFPIVTTSPQQGGIIRAQIDVAASIFKGAQLNLPTFGTGVLSDGPVQRVTLVDIRKQSLETKELDRTSSVITQQLQTDLAENIISAKQPVQRSQGIALKLLTPGSAQNDLPTQFWSNFLSFTPDQLSSISLNSLKLDAAKALNLKPEAVTIYRPEGFAQRWYTQNGPSPSGHFVVAAAPLAGGWTLEATRGIQGELTDRTFSLSISASRVVVRDITNPNNVSELKSFDLTQTGEILKFRDQTVVSLMINAFPANLRSTLGRFQAFAISSALGDEILASLGPDFKWKAGSTWGLRGSSVSGVTSQESVILMPGDIVSMRLLGPNPLFGISFEKPPNIPGVSAYLSSGTMNNISKKVAFEDPRIFPRWSVAVDEQGNASFEPVDSSSVRISGARVVTSSSGDSVAKETTQTLFFPGVVGSNLIQSTTNTNSGSTSFAGAGAQAYANDSKTNYASAAAVNLTIDATAKSAKPVESLTPRTIPDVLPKPDSQPTSGGLLERTTQERQSAGGGDAAPSAEECRQLLQTRVRGATLVSDSVAEKSAQQAERRILEACQRLK